MRILHFQRTGYLKNATVLLLTVAFLFWWGGARPLPVSAETAAASDPTAILAAGLTACREVIDLRDASLPVSELGRVYQALLLDRPELFHVAPRLSYGYTDRSGVRTVTEVYPVYSLTGEALTAARALYGDTVTAILTEMEAVFGDGPRTEADTVLYLHDYLAHRYAYDTRPEAEANANAYALFRDGVGICQAYALAFLALCRGAGLEADVVVSPAMDHAWNHVRVEGEWYHVDVTRDDPIPAEGGSPAVNHTRLLRSDGGMAALGYYGYSCPVEHTCTSDRFETAEGGGLDGFCTPLIHVKTAWVGMDANGGIVGVKFTENGVLVGEMGDVNLDGSTDPGDLLALYDPRAAEAWREEVREYLVRS